MHIFPAIMIKLNQREHLLISNPDSRCTELLPTCPCRCTSWTPVTTCAGTSTTAAACRSKASARPSTSTCTTERAWGGTSLSQSWISFAPWKRCWRGRHPIASTLPRCSSSMRERCDWCWNNYFLLLKFFWFWKCSDSNWFPLGFFWSVGTREPLCLATEDLRVTRRVPLWPGPRCTLWNGHEPEARHRIPALSGVWTDGSGLPITFPSSSHTSPAP